MAEAAVRAEGSARTDGAARTEGAPRTDAAARAEGAAPAVTGARAEAGAPDGAGSGDDARSGGDAEEGDPGVIDAVSAPDAEGRPRRTTRRFPLFTKDTARPEGGGRAASGDAPAPARQWPILAVLGSVGLGLLLVALDAFRFGTILIGAALLAGAVMRWMLPDVGMLAVRSRFTDMVTYGVLGLAIVLLALMAQPNPWLVIPFLDDTLHFTVR
ncbi:DUF3017 domain-containing protein [Streptomyces sp. NBC_01571]|uniref:DUF3017 domain-containing protein n=1 Tax=Streptomyces sp. NBC_01571 TaxID=2975883 RepID=UPI00225B558F|nr:DUF3017 domain-containing protein [Streptomyces sp. NBC_01571]MCX4577007.1 DUF3017 domain-containing protein [Streptomyces sp. NBC_01571]